MVTNSTIYQNVDLYDEFNRVSEGRMHNIRILFLNLDFNEVMCTKFSSAVKKAVLRSNDFQSFLHFGGMSQE